MKRFWLAIPWLLVLFLGTFDRALAINLFNPPDQTVTTTMEIEFSGKVSSDRLEINGLEQPLYSDRSFRTVVKLNVGKNKIVLRLLDRNKQERAVQIVRILRLQTFADLDEDQWSRQPVEYFATLGLVTGFPDGRFDPNGSVTRAQMAEMILNLSTKTSQVKGYNFPDLPIDHWAYPGIIDAVTKKIVTGYPDGTFHPDIKVTRMEALTMISRFADLAPVKEAEPPYFDIPAGYWGEGIVTAAKNAGYLTYLKSDIFGPEDSVSRGEVVILLAKTKFGQAKINELLDFNQGY
jgi:hypothetical protein